MGGQLHLLLITHPVTAAPEGLGDESFSGASGPHRQLPSQSADRTSWVISVLNLNSYLSFILPPMSQWEFCNGCKCENLPLNQNYITAAHYFFHSKIYQRTFPPQLGYCCVFLQTGSSLYDCVYKQNNWFLCCCQQTVQLLLCGIKDFILVIIKHTGFVLYLGVITVVEHLNHCCRGCITGDNWMIDPKLVH